MDMAMETQRAHNRMDTPTRLLFDDLMEAVEAHSELDNYGAIDALAHAIIALSR